MTSFVTENHNLDDICELLTRFIGESVYKRDIKPEGIAKVVASPKVYTVVVYQSAKPIGILMAMEWEHPMFTGKAVSDMLVYVLPEHRGGTIAVRLIKMLEHWGRRIGVDGVKLGQSTQIGDMKRVMKFYEKLGYTVTGFNTMKEF